MTIAPSLRQFYGSALPRPRFYGDPLNPKARTDPPPSVNDSLLRWAADAHWSMGGLSFKRHRLQGKIEGRIEKLRKEEESVESEDDRKSSKKSKFSPGKRSPRSASKKAVSAGGKEGDKKSSRGIGRHGRGVSESPVISVNRSAAIHPAAGPWGEEDGPSPVRDSQKRHAAVVSPAKPVLDSPARSTRSHDVSESIEFPRRRIERALPEGEDSDSDVNLDEFERQKDRPLRRSSRVTAIRRSFKGLLAPDSDQES